MNRTNLGAASHKTSSSTWQIATGQHLPGEQTLAVALCYDSGTTVSGLTWNGIHLGRDQTSFAGGIKTDFWTLRHGKTGTGNLDLTLNGAIVAKAASFYILHDINKIDQRIADFGSNNNPDSSLTPLVTYDDELLVGVVGTEGPDGDASGTWDYDVLVAGNRLGTTGGVDNTNVTIADAWDTISAAQQVRSGKINITARTWITMALTYYFAPNLTCSWLRLSTYTPYNARRSPACAYDIDRGELVCFGGLSVLTGINDTFVWSSGAWNIRAPLHKPDTNHCYGGAMAYDEVNREVVLFGGGWSGTGGQETWVWDGSDWTQKSPVHAPSARRFHAMCWDPNTLSIVLYGGDVGTSETWSWDGSDWTQLSPAHNPGDHRGHAVCWDSNTSTIILFGGQNAAGVGQFTTWSWNGSDWTQLSPATTPDTTQPWFGHFMTARAGKLYIAAGWSVALSTGVILAYEWDGTNWTLLEHACDDSVSPWSVPYANTAPPARNQGCLAYSTADNRLLLFAGSSPYSTVSGTWELLLTTSREGACECVGVAQASLSGLLEKLGSSIASGVAAISFSGDVEHVLTCILRGKYEVKDISDLTDISLDPPLVCSNHFHGITLSDKRYVGFFTKR